MVVAAQRARTARIDRGEMVGAAVGEIVAVDRGDDEMGEAELGGGLRDVFGLMGIERAGQPGLDVAERAGPRAGVPHDHEGGMLLVPAFADIGAAGLLAHGVQAVGAHDVAGVRVPLGHRRPDPDPVGLRERRRVGAMRLFRVPRPRAIDGVEHDDHGQTSLELLTYARAASQGD